mmetsp:Transcript_12942/g.23277  ORF Transcript_12942/g.23277 Transcript_12942/m.23277 type:complete len:1287 (-) Transcript_12942:30-3890(-)
MTVVIAWVGVGLTKNSKVINLNLSKHGRRACNTLPLGERSRIANVSMQSVVSSSVDSQLQLFEQKLVRFLIQNGGSADLNQVGKSCGRPPDITNQMLQDFLLNSPEKFVIKRIFRKSRGNKSTKSVFDISLGPAYSAEMYLAKSNSITRSSTNDSSAIDSVVSVDSSFRTALVTKIPSATIVVVDSSSLQSAVRKIQQSSVVAVAPGYTANEPGLEILEAGQLSVLAIAIATSPGEMIDADSTEVFIFDLKEKQSAAVNYIEKILASSTMVKVAIDGGKLCEALRLTYNVDTVNVVDPIEVRNRLYYRKDVIHEDIMNEVRSNQSTTESQTRFKDHQKAVSEVFNFFGIDAWSSIYSVDVHERAEGVYDLPDLKRIGAFAAALATLFQNMIVTVAREKEMSNLSSLLAMSTAYRDEFKLSRRKVDNEESEDEEENDEYEYSERNEPLDADPMFRSRFRRGNQKQVAPKKKWNQHNYLYRRVGMLAQTTSEKVSIGQSVEDVDLEQLLGGHRNAQQKSPQKAIYDLERLRKAQQGTETEQQFLNGSRNSSQKDSESGESFRLSRKTMSSEILETLGVMRNSLVGLKFDNFYQPTYSPLTEQQVKSMESANAQLRQYLGRNDALMLRLYEQRLQESRMVDSTFAQLLPFLPAAVLKDVQAKLQDIRAGAESFQVMSGGLLLDQITVHRSQGVFFQLCDGRRISLGFKGEELGPLFEQCLGKLHEQPETQVLFGQQSANQSAPTLSPKGRVQTKSVDQVRVRGALHRICVTRNAFNPSRLSQISSETLDESSKMYSDIEGVFVEIERDFDLAVPLVTDLISQVHFAIPSESDAQSQTARCNSVLVLGAPRTGKSTILRGIARELSVGFGKRVVIFEQELSRLSSLGTGVGRAWSVRLPGSRLESDVLKEIEETFQPEVVIVDGVATKSMIDALGSMMARGIAVVASVHIDSLQALLREPELGVLVGGVQRVELSSVEARATVTGRRLRDFRSKDAMFRSLVETLDMSRINLHRSIERSVDFFLEFGYAETEQRALQIETGEDNATVVSMTSTFNYDTTTAREEKASRNQEQLPDMPLRWLAARERLQRYRALQMQFGGVVTYEDLAVALEKLEEEKELERKKAMEQERSKVEEKRMHYESKRKEQKQKRLLKAGELFDDPDFDEDRGYKVRDLQSLPKLNVAKEYESEDEEEPGDIEILDETRIMTLQLLEREGEAERIKELEAFRNREVAIPGHTLIVESIEESVASSSVPIRPSVNTSYALPSTLEHIGVFNDVSELFLDLEFDDEE